MLKLLNKISSLAILFSFSFLSAQSISDLLKNENPAEGFRPFLKIGIKVDTDSFSLEGDAEIFDKNGKNAGSIQGRYTITVNNGRISVSGKKFDSDLIKFTPKFMLIKVGARMFRGEIEIWLKNGKLTVINEFCTFSDSVDITIVSSDLQVPDFFTPNGDGANDEFRVAYKSLKTFNGIIYSRWGRKVFQWTDPAKGWDGNINGRPAAEGGYFYIINAVGTDGQERSEERRGGQQCRYGWWAFD